MGPYLVGIGNACSHGLCGRVPVLPIFIAHATGTHERALICFAHFDFTKSKSPLCPGNCSVLR